MAALFRGRGLFDNAKGANMIPTREKLTATLIEIVTKKLPSGVTEIDRVAKLSYIRLRWTIECAPGLDFDGDQWDAIWSDVMRATGCGTWGQMMNKVKH
jgi:hypothetical protein